jgi:hypothetical protein
VHDPNPVASALEQEYRISERPPIGAMPPHINPSHCVFEPAVDPLAKSGGRGWAVTVNAALRVAPSAAEMVAVKERLLYARYPGLVATVNVALVAPCGTTTLGIVAASSIFELVSVIVAPPAPAGALKVTVPVDEFPLPPAIVDGLSASDVTAIVCASSTTGPSVELPREIAQTIITATIAATFRKLSRRRPGVLRSSICIHPLL